eukprot:gb/GECH01007196.1/.p1 GENE.gb/GECH01007196.1/~~gb/GECH01007196.1/.p1  ORF type:complete len:507 (+),score=112.33 gb/GECH01007196.1/:1-1521(+)
MPSHNDKRYIDNDMPDYSGENLQEILSSNTRKKLAVGKDRVLRLIEDNIKPSSSIGYSVFTGAAGLAYMYLNLYQHSSSESQNKEHYLNLAVEFIESALRRLKRYQKRQGGVSHHVGFVDGESGPLAIATLIYAATGDEDKRKSVAKELISVARIASHEQISANELLYGRAGTLHAILLVKETSSDIITDSVVETLCDRIMSDGYHFGNFKCPLLWEWHDKKYLGAAHGIVGILYILLDVPYVRQNPKWMRDILNSVHFIATELQFPDGNFPTRTDHFELNRPAYSKLVQWCHGAPGVIPLLIKTISLLRSSSINLEHSKSRTETSSSPSPSSSSTHVEHNICNLDLVVVNIPKLITSLRHCIDIAEKHIWERGLLFKGVGLCHGISGNALSILKARSALLMDHQDNESESGNESHLHYGNRNEKYLRSLYHAVNMTLFAVDVDSLSRLIEVPDHPFSLFQGVAGLVWLLSDILETFDVETRDGEQLMDLYEHEIFPALDLFPIKK